MKVYLVWEVVHALPMSYQYLKGIYAKLEDAKKMKAKLDKENINNLVEKDDYGPLSGTEYKIYENEVF